MDTHGLKPQRLAFGELHKTLDLQNVPRSHDGSDPWAPLTRLRDRLGNDVAVLVLQEVVAAEAACRLRLFAPPDMAASSVTSCNHRFVRHCPLRSRCLDGGKLRALAAVWIEQNNGTNDRQTDTQTDRQAGRQT